MLQTPREDCFTHYSVSLISSSSKDEDIKDILVEVRRRMTALQPVTSRHELQTETLLASSQLEKPSSHPLYEKYNVVR